MVETLHALRSASYRDVSPVEYSVPCTQENELISSTVAALATEYEANDVHPQESAEMCTDPYSRIENSTLRQNLTSRSLTVQDLESGFQVLGRQNLIDQAKLEGGALSEVERHVIQETLENRSQVITSLSVYAQPSSIANWYTPFTRAPNTSDGKTSCGVQLINYRILLITINGNVIDFDIPVILFKGVILVLFYFVLYFILQRTVASPGGVVFDILVCIAVSSIVGGFVSAFISLPPLIGILATAVVWNSLPGGVAGHIPTVVKKVSKNIGATIIILKAGLSINLSSMRSTLLPSLCLATISVVGEACGHYIFSLFVHHMDHINAWMYGISLSGTSPAIVVPIGFYMQAYGYGVKSGILPMLFTSVALNVTFCFLVFNILLNIQYPVEGNDNLSLLLGLVPVQVIGGPILGFMVAYCVVLMLRVITARRASNGVAYYNSTMYLAFTMICVSLLFTFAGQYLSLLGGATLAVFGFSLGIKYLTPSDEEHQECFEKASHIVSELWDLVVQPLLFSMIGASTTLGELFAWNNLKFYLATCVIGITSRMIFVVVVLWITSRLILKEMIFVAFALLARATPQAALGGLLKDRVDQNASKYSSGIHDVAEVIESHSLLAIFILAPVSVILMKVLFKSLLRSDQALTLPKTEEVPTHDSEQRSTEHEAGKNPYTGCLKNNPSSDCEISSPSAGARIAFQLPGDPLAHRINAEDRMMGRSRAIAAPDNMGNLDIKKCTSSDNAAHDDTSESFSSND